MQGSSHEKFGVFFVLWPKSTSPIWQPNYFYYFETFFFVGGGGGGCRGFLELASLQLFIVKSSITPLKLRLVKSACGNSSVLYRTFVQIKYILLNILPTNSQFIYLFFIYTKS